MEEAIEIHVRAALEGQTRRQTIELFGPPRRVVSVSAVPLADGGAVAIIEDVTERSRLDAVRTDFVANISHELKTPVGAMAVLADALLGEDDQETIQRLVGRMVFEAERAARTIDDLLQLTEIELGAEIETVPLDAVSLMQAAGERVRHSARERSVEVHLTSQSSRSPLSANRDNSPPRSGISSRTRSSIPRKVAAWIFRSRMMATPWRSPCLTRASVSHSVRLSGSSSASTESTRRGAGARAGRGSARDRSPRRHQPWWFGGSDVGGRGGEHLRAPDSEFATSRSG